MQFQVGNKIKVLDADQKGVVIRIQKNLITILNDFGFEETFRSNELILDVAFEVGEIKPNRTPSDTNSKKISKRKEVLAPKEIDLHFPSLVDFPGRFEPYEKLQIQLDKVKEELELAKGKKGQRIVFIHGHGSGKLKNEILKLLKNYSQIEVYDASFKKFNGGATEVKFV